MRQISQKLCMVMSMLCLAISASAYDFEVDGIYCNVIDLGKLEIEIANPFPNEAYTKTEIVIPSEIEYNGRKFVPIRIGKRAFYHTQNLKSIYLPPSIKTIGKEAFKDSGLFTINLEDGLEIIEESAFENCTNLNLTIPVSVETIDTKAFYCCKSLRDKQVLKGFIGKHAFSGCNSLTEVDLFDVIEISSGAFYDTSFKPERLNISANTKVIGFDAIQDVQHLIIADSQEELNNNCDFPSLKSLYLGRNAKIKCDRLLKKIVIGSQVTKLAGGFYSESSMFESAVSLDTLIIEDSESTLEMGYLKYVKPGYGTIGAGLFVSCPLKDYVYIGRPLRVKTDSEYGFSPFAKVSYTGGYIKVLEFSNNITSNLEMNFFHSLKIDYLICGANLSFSKYVFSNSNAINNLVLKQLKPIEN